MENEHISIEEMEQVAYFSGKLDSEEGKKFLEIASKVNTHISQCQDCFNKYKEIMEKADTEKWMADKKDNVKMLYDEIFKDKDSAEVSTDKKEQYYKLKSLYEDVEAMQFKIPVGIPVAGKSKGGAASLQFAVKNQKGDYDITSEPCEMTGEFFEYPEEDRKKLIDKIEQLEKELVDIEVSKFEEDIETSDGDYSSFELAEDIEDIPDNNIRIGVMLHYADRLWGIPAVTDKIARSASPEKKAQIAEVFKKNGIGLNPNIFKVDSIEMRIAEDAAKKWNEPLPQNLEEAKKITGGLEISAVHGIVSTLGIDPIYEESMLDDIYGKTRISSADEEIKEAITGKNKSKCVLDILSTIHNEWVKNHPDNFLKENRNKERQFVPLQLLDWGEVESDLLFLKPILEGAGIPIYEPWIKEEFELEQQEYMAEHGISSHEALVSHLGSDFYPTLEGLETINGGNIEELLKSEEIRERMATQIESRVQLKTKEDNTLSTEGSKTTNVEGLEDINPEKIKEIILNGDNEVGFVDSSSTTDPSWVPDSMKKFVMHQPMPRSLFELGKSGIGFPGSIMNYNATASFKEPIYWYENKFKSYDNCNDYQKQKIDERNEIISKLSQKVDNDKNGKYSKIGVVSIPIYKDEEEVGKIDIEVTQKELIEAGIIPNELNWKSIQRSKEGKQKNPSISPKDIADADKEQALTTTEVGGFKKLLNKLRDMFKGKGEK